MRGLVRVLRGLERFDVGQTRCPRLVPSCRLLQATAACTEEASRLAPALHILRWPRWCCPVSGHEHPTGGQSPATRQFHPPNAAHLRRVRTTCGGISFADRLRRNIQSEGAREEGIAMFRDIRFAIRSATRNPVLTAVIVISLALGIGANTTIFTLINAVFLRPLPVNDPARLAQVFTVMPKSTAYQSVSLANYRDFRDNVSEFSGLAAFQFIGANMAGGTEPLSIGGHLVAANSFKL